MKLRSNLSKPSKIYCQSKRCEMDNIVEMSEIEVKSSTVIQILSEVIQTYLIKESSDREKIK